MNVQESHLNENEYDILADQDEEGITPISQKRMSMTKSELIRFEREYDE